MNRTEVRCLPCDSFYIGKTAFLAPQACDCKLHEVICSLWLMSCKL